MPCWKKALSWSHRCCWRGEYVLFDQSSPGDVTSLLHLFYLRFIKLYSSTALLYLNLHQYSESVAQLQYPCFKAQIQSTRPALHVVQHTCYYNGFIVQTAATTLRQIPFHACQTALCLIRKLDKFLIMTLAHLRCQHHAELSWTLHGAAGCCLSRARVQSVQRCRAVTLPEGEPPRLLAPSPIC